MESQADGLSRVPDRTRNDDILDAALYLFAEQGYHATTMNDIARRVGLKGPSLYNHMSSKQDLLVTVMTRTAQRLLKNFYLAVEATSEPAEQLRRATESHVRYHAQHNYDATVGSREMRSLDPEPRAAVLAVRREYADGFRKILEEGCASGVFRTTNPRLTSYAIMGMGVGVANWYQEGAGYSVEEVAAHYGELALQMADAARRTKRPRTKAVKDAGPAEH